MNLSLSCRHVVAHTDAHEPPRAHAPEDPGTLLFTAKKFKVEVSPAGVLIGESDAVETMYDNTGFRVKASEVLHVACALPQAVVLTLQLDLSLEDPLGEGLSLTSGHWEWSGASKGKGDYQDQIASFLCGIAKPASAEDGSAVMEFRVSMTCGDRMQRDALALSIAALASYASPDVENTRRLRALPWLGGDGLIAHCSSSSTQDLAARMKGIEDENATLRRQKTELALQLLERSQHGFAFSESTFEEPDETAGDGRDDSLREKDAARISELEAALAESKSKEVRVKPF